MNLKLIRNLVLVLIVAALSGLIGYRLGTNEVKTSWNGFVPNVSVKNQLPPNSQQVDFSLFWGVWDEVSQKYVDKTKLDPQKMVYGAISGMVSAIGDPYTVFLPPTQNKQAKEQLNGNFEGIGAELGFKDQNIIVVAPIAGSPAEAAGIKGGDYIIKVNGESTEGWTLPQAVGKIRGPKGTTVTLNILHDKAKSPQDIKVVRDAIILPSVQWRVVSSTASASLKSAAYIQLSRFGDQTDSQWDKVISEVSGYMATSSAKSAGVILDVRGNPGGLLSDAVYIAGEFLPQGAVVVKQQNYDGSVQTYSVDHTGRVLKTPLVVLIDQGAASASEILSGALQVAGRAKLVGHQSFGKGSVQQAEDLPGGAGLHVTEAKWLLSNDVWIQGKGLTPDVKVELDDKNPTFDTQLDRAIQFLNKAQ